MPKPAPTKPAMKKPATKKAAAKKAEAKKASKKPAAKTAAVKRAAAKKAVKSAPKRAAAKKAATKEPAAKKAAAVPAAPVRSDGGPQHFLIKSEPYVFSFDQLRRDGRAVWDGVRSFEARNNLRAMQPGDWLLFYHSNEGKEIVGIAVVSRAAYPDPSAPGEDWSAVDIAPLCALAQPVTLAAVKAEPRLKDFNLVRKGRVSVVPVTPTEFAQILTMAKTRLPTEDSDGRELRGA
jgi:predicted RNA-binding protein with PUA-like domain